MSVDTNGVSAATMADPSPPVHDEHPPTPVITPVAPPEPESQSSTRSGRKRAPPTRSGSKRSVASMAAAPSASRKDPSSGSSKRINSSSTMRTDTESSVNDGRDQSYDQAALSSRFTTFEEALSAMREENRSLRSAMSSQHDTLLRLVRDARESDRCDELWDLLVETRQRLAPLATTLASMMPRAEVTGLISELRRDISNVVSASHRTHAPMPSLPSLTPHQPSAPCHPPTPSDTNSPPLPNVAAPPPSDARTPVPHTASPAAAPLDLLPAPANLVPAPFKGKRALRSDDEDGSPGSAKRPRKAVFVQMGYMSSNGNPLDIAQYVAGTIGAQGRYIENAMWSRGQKGWIRIRFSDLQSATSFITCLAAATPAMGLGSLTAYIADDQENGRRCMLNRDDVHYITCAFWNIRGDFAGILSEKAFLSFLQQLDLLFVVETWLRRDGELPLDLPHGYDIVSLPRPPTTNGAARGGIAMLFKSVWGPILTIRHDLSDSNVMVAEFGDIFFLNAYLPPETMEWLSTTPNHPCDSFQNVLTRCAACPGRQIAVFLDANGRTASQSPSSSWPRHSMDTMSNSRGKWLLRLCSTFHLCILNGTEADSDVPGCFTSFHGGAAVVDYIIVSESLASTVSSPLMVLDQFPQESDHATLQLTFAVDAIDVTGLAHKPPDHTLSSKSNFGELSSPLDTMLEETLATAMDDGSLTRRLYGNAEMNSHPYLAYIASAKPAHGARESEHSLMGVGIFWGHNSRNNAPLTFAGEQSSTRADLHALAYVLYASSPDIRLHVYTTSAMLIRTVAFEAGRTANMNWSCSNADVLKVIVALVQHRHAPVELKLIQRTLPLVEWKEAKQLATKASMERSTTVWQLPSHCIPDPIGPVSGLDVPKLHAAPLPVHQDVSESASTRPKRLPPKPSPPLSISPSHRTRFRERQRQWENLSSLLSAKTSAQFWRLIRQWMDPKNRASKMTADKLRVEFEQRQNPPETPFHLQSDKCRRFQTIGHAIPLHTSDRSDSRFFDRDPTAEEVGAVKSKLMERSMTSSPGLEGSSATYKVFVAIPNDIIATLWKACLDSCDNPTKWLYSSLIGLLKKGKNPIDPASYRVIGLESCFLKALTLLFAMRLQEWSEAGNIIPDSQNGFRRGYRTHDNSFVLHTARDRAKADNKTLFVAFIDLKNAYPWTNLPTMWAKMYTLGAGGKFFDWMRRTYSDMKYVVRHQGEFSLLFQMRQGLLTGDSGAPDCWIVFMHDFPEYVEQNGLTDPVLNGRPIAHIEQADDVAEMSLEAEALQSKLHGTQRWAGDSSAVISAPKSRWMPLGKMITAQWKTPYFRLNDQHLEKVDHHPYVGIDFKSTDRRKSFFSHHYETRAQKGANASSAIFAVQDRTGPIPIKELRILYMARVAPHLDFGCEVIVDISVTMLEKLEQVQQRYLRRMLGLHSRSPRCVLFIESGMVPIKYRRIHLCLRYLHYLLHLPPNRLAYHALHENQRMVSEGTDCWLGDLLIALDDIGIHRTADELFDADTVLELAAQVIDKSWSDLMHELHQSTKLSILQSRYAPDYMPPRMGANFAYPNYLSTPIVDHRKSLTRLLTSTHRLAVETLRWAKTPTGSEIPRCARLCRFCRAGVEDEMHAFWGCSGSPLLRLERNIFVSKAAMTKPEFASVLKTGHALAIFNTAVDDDKLFPILAAFVHKALAIFAEAPAYLPSELEIQSLSEPVQNDEDMYDFTVPDECDWDDVDDFEPRDDMI